MDIQVKSSNGITLAPIESRLMAERKIFIEGEINAESACEFIKKVILLNSEALDSPIDVLINSTGGEINSGMLMYDVIQSSSAPIRTFCIGKAYSMAAILLACGNHGRYILPHGELMIHEPLIMSNISGSSSSIKSISDSLLETKETMNQIEEFLLECSEEAFHPGVIKAAVNATEALQNTCFIEFFTECFTCILASAI